MQRLITHSNLKSSIFFLFLVKTSTFIIKKNKLHSLIVTSCIQEGCLFQPNQTTRMRPYPLGNRMCYTIASTRNMRNQLTNIKKLDLSFLFSRFISTRQSNSTSAGQNPMFLATNIPLQMAIASIISTHNTTQSISHLILPFTIHDNQPNSHLTFNFSNNISIHQILCHHPSQLC